MYKEIFLSIYLTLHHVWSLSAQMFDGVEYIHRSFSFDSVKSIEKATEHPSPSYTSTAHE